MATKDTIKITSSDGWVNITTVSGVVIGTELTVQNNSKTFVYAYEGVSPPSDDTQIFMIYPSGTTGISMTLGSGLWSIWVKAPSDLFPYILSIQD